MQGGLRGRLEPVKTARGKINDQDQAEAVARRQGVQGTVSDIDQRGYGGDWYIQVDHARILNVPGYKATTEMIDALCKYFGCGPGELLQFIPDEKPVSKAKAEKKK